MGSTGQLLHSESSKGCDTAKDIADRLVAVKAFADRAVRTNKKRVLANSSAESIFGRREERIEFRNVKAKLSHASGKIGYASGKFFHS